MRLHVKTWEAWDDEGNPVGWLDQSHNEWRAGIYGIGYITDATTLTKATQELKAQIESRGMRLAS